MKDPNVIPGSGGSDDVGSTASSLLERARARAPGAWERLSALYCPLVYGWARRLGLRAEDAADVVQEVFRAVVAHLADYRHDRAGDTFRGWLWTIAQNKIRDWRRRQANQPEARGGTDAHERLLQVPEPPTAGSADSNLTRVNPLLTQALEQIRSEFEERSWQAFWGVVVNARTPADVAAALSMSVNAVYVARSRILRRLREELHELPS